MKAYLAVNTAKYDYYSREDCYAYNYWDTKDGKKMSAIKSISRAYYVMDCYPVHHRGGAFYGYIDAHVEWFMYGANIPNEWD